ncbi:MAG: BamA/TamA family outer membrane protein [Bacteroidota bacterium]|nr:BamA/TamA family outer membrane protein [Bacteroidota bacterium]
MAMRRLHPIHAFLCALILIAAPHGTVTAQYFGKNKVQYTPFAWYYIQSDHFDIYFSQEGEAIASFAARAAEEALNRIQELFRYRISKRIPILVYNSHNDFQQTNAVAIYMEEGVGGVTELFKNRVIVPFEGSYTLFRHVIHHELVHAVLNEMFYGGSIQSIIENNIRLQLPAWFNEGLAEYSSWGGWDVHSDMFLRDASTSNYLPEIRRLDGYFAYRGGQSVWWYIAEKYGPQKVGEIVGKVRSMRNVDQGFKSSVGFTVEELSERWMKEQKKLYYPDVAKRVLLEDFAKRLTNHNKTKNFYNSSPALSPSGDRVAFISDRDDYYSIYLMSSSDGKDVRKIVEGQTTSDFEELHLLTPRISWSPDGTRIAIAVKAGANDAIFLIDVKTGKRTRLPVEMDGIFSVDWSPRGDRLAFIGNNARQSDLWVYDLGTKTVRNCTNDIFSDADPSWSPDGSTVYFVSDRGSFLRSADIPPGFDMLRHVSSKTDLYSLDVETGVVRRLTDTPDANESSPVAGPDGTKLLFISDACGVNNISVYRLDTGEHYPVTNFLSGVYQLSLSRDGSKLVFSSLYEAGFDIFLIRSPFDLPKTLPEPTEFLKRRARDSVLTEAESARSDSVTVTTTASAPVDRKAYGEDVSVDLGMHVERRDTASQAVSPGRILFQPGSPLLAGQTHPDTQVAPMGNVDESGAFIARKYKINFTPDFVYGNGGYNTFYGILGMATLAFSDMLGDHQIVLEGYLNGELKNSDLALAYYYLPKRVDWGFLIYQTARFLYTPTIYPIDSLRVLIRDDLYRYSQYGAQISAVYPIDKFNRIETGLNILNISKENLENADILPVSRFVLLPEFAYVHDNTLFGEWAPVRGSRSETRLSLSPGIGGNSLRFASFLYDYRKYFKFWSDFSFVLRGAAGVSVGPNAQRFFIGGTENWVNRRFETGRIPIESAEDFAFLTPLLPLRGYNYTARITTKAALGNAELRFPLVRYFLGGILPYILQSINAVAFVDVGAAVDRVEDFRAFERTENGVKNRDLLVGTGFGARMWFLGFPLRFDVGWAYEGAGFSPPTYYFSIGADF